MRALQNVEDRDRSLFGDRIAPILEKYNQTRRLGVDDPVVLILDADDPDGRAIAQATGRGSNIADFVARADRPGVAPVLIWGIRQGGCVPRSPASGPRRPRRSRGPTAATATPRSSS